MPKKILHGVVVSDKENKTINRHSEMIGWFLDKPDKSSILS